MENPAGRRGQSQILDRTNLKILLECVPCKILLLSEPHQHYLFRAQSQRMSSATGKFCHALEHELFYIFFGSACWIGCVYGAQLSAVFVATFAVNLPEVGQALILDQHWYANTLDIFAEILGQLPASSTQKSYWPVSRGPTVKTLKFS